MPVVLGAPHRKSSVNASNVLLKRSSVLFEIAGICGPLPVQGETVGTISGVVNCSPNQALSSCSRYDCRWLTWMIHHLEIRHLEIWSPEMLKTLLVAAAASALITSSAIAQPQTSQGPAAQGTNSPASEGPAAQGTNSPASQGPAAQAQGTNSPASAKFIAAQPADQWVFTKFKGIDVLGPDNANVGSVNDLLFDKAGKISGVVVGVGGILGIGAKNVAIDMSAFDVVPAGSGGNDGSNAPSSAAHDPSDVKLKVAWTRDQLKAAPDFQYYKPPAGMATTSSPSTTGAAPPANSRPRPQ